VAVLAWSCTARAPSVAIALRLARPAVAVAVAFVTVLGATRGVLLATPSRRCARTGACPLPVSAITLVGLARQTPIDRSLLVAVVLSRDRAAGQALDVAQLA